MKKRVIALMLAFVLVLNMGTVAFANGEATPAPVTETEPTPTQEVEATLTPAPIAEAPSPVAEVIPTPTSEVVLESISVTQTPDKLEYLCTDTVVDSTGGLLTLTFSDRTTQTVDLSVATLSLVKEAVNVTYEDMTDSFAVTVTHSYDEGVITTEATATEPGVMTYTCADCGDEQTGEIPMAVATEIASGICGAEGDNLTWTLDSDGVLTISGAGAMADFEGTTPPWSDESNAPWIQYKEQVYKVVVEEGVTSIGEMAFFNCTAIEEIIIPEGITSIGSAAFAGCKNVSKMAIPDSVTEIGSGAFGACRSLETLNIPKDVTSLDALTFEHCDSLEAINVAEGNANYYSIDGVLYGYYDSIYGERSLELIKYPPKRVATEYVITENIVSISPWAFQDSSLLTSIIMPNSLKTIEQSAFINCTGLQEITIPENVEYIGNCIFYNGINDKCGITTIRFTGDAPEFASDALNEATATAYYYATKNWTEDNFQNYGGTITWKAIAETVVIGTCGAEGDNLTWTLDSDGVLTISGTGAMKDYPNEIGAPWADFADDLTKVVIEEGITTIGASAFMYCDNLTEVVIPGTVTSIGSTAFLGCNSLTKFDIPEGVISVGGEAFGQCSALERINIPSSLTSFGERMFMNGAEKLTEINVDSGNTVYSSKEGVLYSKDGSTLVCYPCGKEDSSYIVPEGVTAIGNNAFEGCNVTQVKLPDTLTRIGADAFMNCQFLKTVNIPNGVSTIESGAFSCGITSISIPASVTEMESAFTESYALTEINVDSSNPNYMSKDGVLFNKDGKELICYPDRKTDIEYTVSDGVVTIKDGAFADTRNLKKVTIPGNVKTIEKYAFSTMFSSLEEVVLSEGLAVIDDGAFSWCFGLTSITIPASVTKIGERAFIESGLTGISFKGDALQIADNAFTNVTATVKYLHTKNWPEDKLQDYGGTLTWVEIDNEVASGTCGAEGDNLTWTLDSDGVLTISGTGAMKNYSNNHGDQNYAPWHDYTQKIKSVVIDDGATTIGEYAFLGCSVLADITIPDSVKRIEGGAFSYCNALESIELPADLEYLGNSAFLSCVRLTNVNIPSSIKKIGEGTFYGCRSLAELVIPDGVTAVGELAFEGCVSLTTINIPLSVKNIGGGAFIGCSSLKTLTVHEDVAIGSAVFAKCGFETAGPIGSGSDLEFGWTESIPDYAFEGCNSLKNVIIPSGVKNIGAGAFRSCTALAGITIPAGVETIQDRTFYGCSNIAEIVIPANVNSIGEQAFLDCSALTSITIPGRIKSIGSSAFWGCSNLKEIKFEGDAPAIDEYVFNEVTATAYYLHTKEWEEEDLQNYGGKITWQLCCENFEECEVIKDEAVEPTFDSTGLTEGSHCSVCEKPIVAQNELPKLAVTELEITAPDKLVYYKGESLDSTGLTVTAKLNNDTNIDVTDQVQLEGFSSNAAGTKTITVSFKDAQATFDVQVFSFTSVSLSLEGRVIINFYANFPDYAEAGYTPGILFFRKQPDGDEIVAAYNAGEGVTSYVVADNGALMFSYDKLAAKELNDKVYATLYAVQNDGKVVFGTPTPISAAEYAISTFGLYANDARLQTLMVDMLNFGAAAQNEFDYRTNALANSNMSATMAAKATKDNVSLSNGMKLYKDGLSSDKVTIKSASLSLDNEISINFYAEIKGDIKKAELLIFDEYTAGGVYDKNTASKRTDMVPHEDMYAGFITGIAAKSMRDLYYARVYVQFEDGTEAYSGIGQYSVESYAWQVRNGSGFSSKLKLLMEEMMKYGDSAKMYMENKNNNANG